ncbi:MAG: transposase, partial [Hyphomicrobiales bacterium]|nr:transposase [Hyphomicrobiales bacterium]
MKNYLTAREIAEAAKRLSIASVPSTKRGVNALAQREGWASNATLAKSLAGTQGGGGAIAYHVSLLPPAMRAALEGEASRAAAVRGSRDVRAVEEKRREALDTTVLSARQRRVMDARAAVLNAIEAVQIQNGLSRSQAVEQFVAEVSAQADDGDVRGLPLETIRAASERGALSRRSLLRWFAYREKGNIGAIAPQAKKQKSDLPAIFWDFMQCYARPQKPCITEALAAFNAARKTGPDGQTQLSYGQARRYLARLGNVEKHRGREGALTLKARMAYVTRSTADLLPTCVYTADGKTFDAEVAHPIHGRPFRPEITSVVDVATRKCVGFSIGLAENAEGVVDALRYACEQHGIPAIFYVDRGSGFKNTRFDDALTGLMGRLGITKYHSLPQNSQARGIIERFQGTVWNPLARTFATYIGADMDRQARQKSFKVTRKQIREFGSSAALPAWSEFLDGCMRAIADYNAAPHTALPNRMSPDAYWQAHVDGGFEPVPVTAAESADLFRPYVKRRTRRALVEFLGNKYFALALEEFDGEDVLVGYDIHDAKRVWVREIDRASGEAGRLICIADFAGNEQ